MWAGKRHRFTQVYVAMSNITWCPRNGRWKPLPDCQGDVTWCEISLTSNADLFGEIKKPMRPSSPPVRHEGDACLRLCRARRKLKENHAELSAYISQFVRVSIFAMRFCLNILKWMQYVQADDRGTLYSFTSRMTSAASSSSLALKGSIIRMYHSIFSNLAAASTSWLYTQQLQLCQSVAFFSGLTGRLARQLWGIYGMVSVEIGCGQGGHPRERQESCTDSLPRWGARW